MSRIFGCFIRQSLRTSAALYCCLELSVVCFLKPRTTIRKTFFSEEKEKHLRFFFTFAIWMYSCVGKWPHRKYKEWNNYRNILTGGQNLFYRCLRCLNHLSPSSFTLNSPQFSQSSRKFFNLILWKNLNFAFGFLGLPRLSQIFFPFNSRTSCEDSMQWCIISSSLFISILNYRLTTINIHSRLIIFIIIIYI